MQLCEIDSGSDGSIARSYLCPYHVVLEGLLLWPLSCLVLYRVIWC